MDQKKASRLSSFKEGRVMVGVNKFKNPNGLNGELNSSENLSKEIAK
jgi:hypothetical protein